MADGKIARIEEVNNAVRQDQINFLSDKVNAIQRGEAKDILSIREGIKVQKSSLSDKV